MIEIVVIGVNHNDPLGREKISRILKEELTDFIPDAIAVEWKKEIAYEVVRQRIVMKKVLSQQYPSADPNDLDLLANAMAFESDSHIKIYPNLPIIWLDQERLVDLSDDDVTNFYIYRKSYYDSIINIGINSISDISDYVCRTMGTNGPSERDHMFYDLLQKEIEENGYKRIICIVGAYHANLIEEKRFANMLIRAGYKVIAFNTTLV